MHNKILPQYVSHVVRNKCGEVICQSNEEHCVGVANLSQKFAEEFGMGSWGNAMGLLHDKGKERVAFQQYIRTVNGLSLTAGKPYAEHHHAYVGGILTTIYMGKGVFKLLTNQIIDKNREE